MKAPIAVMSFNRPEFLAPVLHSLKAQRADSLEGREIHLFQDGACNRYSRMRYAQDADIQASIACFKQEFPEGVVHDAGDNIGIFENFSAAEEYFFTERQFDCAYFFEDDLVLSPAYLDMMDLLRRKAEASQRVAYFAAYGDYYASRQEVAERKREVITLDHHWAFGLLRRHWLKIRDALADYRALVGGQDYARRYHREIYAYYEQFGAVPRGSSQDAAKAFACDRLGLWRCRTFAPFAKYIGTTGAHMTPEVYKELGFDKTVVSQEPILNIRFPDDRDVGRFLAEQHQLFVDVYQTELPEIVRTLPARKYNPMRLCTAEDVTEAYQLFLHRNPESAELVARHAGRTPVYLLVRGLLQSAELANIVAAPEQVKRPLPPDRPSTREDVATGYRLLLHRDPDSEQVMDHYVGTGVLAFAKGIYDSKEFAELSGRIVPR